MEGNADGPDRLRRAAKVGHRKSRNGCKKCKSRRVKCDEARPLCGNCLRLGLDCSWPDTSPGHNTQSPPDHVSPDSASGSASGSAPGAKSSSSVQHHRGPEWSTGESIWANLDGSQDVELPESRARRLLEHRLMQNWLHNLVMPFPVAPGPEWIDLWNKVVPALCLKYDNLLYAVLAQSATHLLRDEPNNLDLYSARQSYLVATMHAQRKMVENLTPETADAVCLTSIMILISSFAILYERAIEPYTPPVEWLQMGKGAGTVIWISVPAILKSSGAASSSMLKIANSHPRFGSDESYFDESNRSEFKGVLTQSLPSGDTWDAETSEAYEKTLSYVGSIQKAIERGEPVYAVCRRIQGFAMVMPVKFVDMLAERRPRALVVLAHYFATVWQVGYVWWLGADTEERESTPKREIRAIQAVLPPEWKGQMIWPLDIVGLA